ncbi:MAG: heparin lyase I family protein [Pseudomonadota bacterium]
MQGFNYLAALTVLALAGGCLATDPASERAQTIRQSLFSPPDGYERFFSPAQHNFRVGLTDTGDPVRRGRLSERFELRDGDCGGSDCGNPRARAEIAVNDDANPARIGQDIWYGWSFYNENVPSFQRDNSLRLVFGQWTMGGKNRPIIRLIQLGAGEGNFDRCDPAICAGPNTAQGDLVVHLDDIATASGWGARENNGYVCRLFDLADRQGTWTDITLNTNFSTGADGYLRIWVNNQLACNYAGPVVSAASAASGRQPEHRRGIFSSWTRRWEQATGGTARPTLIVYYDEFRAGATLAAVDVGQATFNNLPPVQ